MKWKDLYIAKEIRRTVEKLMMKREIKDHKSIHIVLNLNFIRFRKTGVRGIVGYVQFDKDSYLNIYVELLKDSKSVEVYLL